MLITMADEALELIDNDVENCIPLSPQITSSAKRHNQLTDIDYGPGKKAL
jgi:hypothetical protein